MVLYLFRWRHQCEWGHRAKETFQESAAKVVCTIASKISKRTTKICFWNSYFIDCCASNHIDNHVIYERKKEVSRSKFLTMTDFLLKASLGKVVQGQMNADQGQLRVLCLRDEYRSALIMTYELLMALELYTCIRLPFKAIYSQLRNTIAWIYIITFKH